MTEYVVKFCLKHHIRLPNKEADNYRIIPFAVYHGQLQIGTCKEGITNGLLAFLLSPVDKTIYEVHWFNCKKADSGENAQYKTGKSLQRVGKIREKKPKKETKQEERERKLRELLGDL